MVATAAGVARLAITADEPSTAAAGAYASAKGRLTVLLGSAGSNVTDYVAMDGSNITVTVDVHDLEAARTMLAAPPAETLAAMQRHGVIPPVTAYIER
jgi:hypothetical protein